MLGQNPYQKMQNNDIKFLKTENTWAIKYWPLSFTETDKK